MPQVIHIAAALAITLAGALIIPHHARAQGTPPGVDLIFSNPAIDEPQLSPDGERLLFIRRRQPGDQVDHTVVIIDFADLNNPRVTHLPVSTNTAQWVSWANNERILVSLGGMARVEGRGALMQDADGNRFLITRMWRSVLTSMNADGSNPVRLLENQSRGPTVFQSQMDRVIDFLPDDPDHILIALRHPRSAQLNVHRVNVNNGRDRRIDTGRAESLVWFTNGEGETVMRIDASQRYESADVLVRRGDGQRWRRVARQDLSRFSELQNGVQWAARSDEFGEALVWARAHGSNTMGLHRYSLTEGALMQPLFEHERYDIHEVRVDPWTGRALSLTWADERSYVEVFDPIAAQFLPAIRSEFGEDLVVEPLQRAGSRVLLSVSGPRKPLSYYLYDYQADEMVSVGAAQPQLQDSGLAEVSVHRYTASDGTELFGYLTHPLYPASKQQALVVLPHGGPEWRDFYGFDALAQLIAAEGFLVFQPQFRGSSGFGRQFAEAGHGEWGGLIQQDITDGVRDLIASGQVDPDRICVAGWSFGGYSALMQAILEPELYQCAAAGAPVTDLPEMLSWTEDGREEPFQRLRDMIGHPDTARMIAHSPARRADEIAIPILLVHGENDRIVPLEQSQIMADALTAAGAQSELVEFNGGHALDNRREMRIAMFHITGFLRDHLDPY